MGKRQLKFYEIISGHWSLAGNFLGETVNGDIIHIYKKQMELLDYRPIVSISADEKLLEIPEIKFPIYTLSYDKEFVNAKGENATRITAASIWKSYSHLIIALLEEIELKNLD